MKFLFLPISARESYWPFSLQAKAVVGHDLSKAFAAGLTTDGWTSRATESYLSLTVHHITSDRNMVIHVVSLNPFMKNTHAQIF